MITLFGRKVGSKLTAGASPREQLFTKMSTANVECWHESGCSVQQAYQLKARVTYVKIFLCKLQMCWCRLSAV